MDYSGYSFSATTHAEFFKAESELIRFGERLAYSPSAKYMRATLLAIDAIFAIGAGDKLLFGTDWPILSVPRYQKILARTKLTEEEKNRLLFQNAQNFLTDTQN